jgi:hypothetical protein
VRQLLLVVSVFELFVVKDKVEAEERPAVPAFVQFFGRNCIIKIKFNISDCGAFFSLYL